MTHSKNKKTKNVDSTVIAETPIKIYPSSCDLITHDQSVLTSTFALRERDVT